MKVWFLALEVSDQIAVGGIVAGIVVAVVVPLLLYFLSNRKKGKTASQIIVLPQSFLDNLQRKYPERRVSSEENQSIRALLQKLVTSQKKHAVFHEISEGRDKKAIDLLEHLEQQQSQNPKGQKQELIDTKLELAAIYTFSDAEKSRGLLQEVIAIKPNHYQANALYALLLMRLGKVEQARDILEGMEQLSRHDQNVAMQYVFLGNLGIAHARLGDIEKAIHYQQQALGISREIKNRHNEGIHLGNLGTAYYRLGHFEKAIRCHHQSLEISHEIKDRKGEGNNFGNLGLVYYILGDVDKAIQHYQQALEISREIEDRDGEGNHLNNLGLAYAKLDQVDKAMDYYHQALKISREIKDRQGEGIHLGNLGLAYLGLEQVDKAIDYYQQALSIFEEIKSPNAEQARNHLKNLQQPYNK